MTDRQPDSPEPTKEVAPELEATAGAETPVSHQAPSGPEPSSTPQVGRFDAAAWGAVALGVAVALLVALAFLAAASRSL